MKNISSLIELEKIKTELIKWIQSDEKYLDDFKSYYFTKGNKLKFIIGFQEYSLDSYRDKNTNKPLSDQQKENIKSVIEKLESEKKRLNEINKQIVEIILGNQVNSRPKNKKSKNKYDNNYLAEVYLNTALKINDIPKPSIDLIKYATATKWTNFLKNKNCIIELARLVEQKLNTKRNISIEKIQTLEMLRDKCLSDMQIVSNKNESKKAPEIVYTDNENLDYLSEEKFKKSKKFSIDN